jgi:hypothetical protein
MKKILILMLLLTACDDYNTTNQGINKISYFKDERTGLCFAGEYLGYNSAVLANVPCSPEVLKLIELQKGVPQNSCK